MKNIFLFGLFACHVFTSIAQNSEIDFAHYKPLVCKGEIPQDFKTELSKLVNDAKLNGKHKDKTNAQREKEFAELSNHQLNNILYSGNVLYGDILTEYVNKVADVVLQNDKQLRNKVRFYVLKNSDLNAYSTQRGIVFISIGLLTEIETEAQLAFIICHEIIHFKNNHNLETYKHNKTVFGGKDKSGYDNNRLNNVMNYSKDNELEADKEGLELFLNTPYGSKELNNLFDVMLYSYLPFDEIAFDTLFFNQGPAYLLPTKFFTNKLPLISAEEDVSDSLSSHPNIKKRREAIQLLLKEHEGHKGESFIQSKTDFQIMQRVARYELALIYLSNAETEEALYTGYLLEKLYEKSEFTEKVICGALYVLSKQKNHDELPERSPIQITNSEDDEDDEDKEYWESIEGESAAVYYFAYKIPAKDLNILVAKRMLEAYNTYGDEYFKTRFYSMTYELVNEHNLKFKTFYSAYKTEDSAENDLDTLIEEDSSPKKLSKISKIKMRKALQSNTKEYDDTYYKYAFVDLYSDTLLESSFDYYLDQKNEDEDLKSSIDYITYSEKKSKVEEKHGQGLDIDKFVMINPYYSKYLLEFHYYNYTFYKYRTKDPELSPLQELKIEQNIVEDIQKYASSIGLEVDIIGANQQKEIDTDQFNDFQQLLTWFSERLSIGKMGAYTFNAQYMKKYVDDYGYIGFCYVSNVNNSLETTFLLFDLKSGGSKFIYSNEVKKGSPNGAFAKMMLYDILHQIKQKPHRVDQLKKKYGIDE
jgi:Zn-dependent protease with chaperone function